MAQAPSAGPDIALARAALIPSSVVLSFALYYSAAWPMPQVLLAVSPLVVLYLIAPRLGLWSAAAFDRDAVALLVRGKRRELPARLERAWLMRLFAPPRVAAEKSAFVAAELGQHEKARAAYAKLTDELGDRAPLSVRLGHAHASFALGRHEEAADAYAKLLGQAGHLPNVRRNYAHAIVRTGERLREALTLLDESLAAGADRDTRAELQLVRALAYTKLRDKRAARAALDAAGDCDTPTARTLRTELEEESG